MPVACSTRETHAVSRTANTTFRIFVPFVRIVFVPFTAIRFVIVVLQKSNFRANCIIRGSSAWVIFPKLALLSDVTGAMKLV